MAISRVSGNILQDNLQRGANLSIQGNLAYFDVTNDRVGINTNSPAQDLTVAGNLGIGNYIVVESETISSAGNIILLPTGNISASNVNINDLAGPVANSDAATKYYVDSSLTGFVTFEDDGANTTSISAGDTVLFSGVTNETDVVVGPLSVTVGLTDDVIIANTLTTVGNAYLSNIIVSGNSISTNLGKVTLGSNANIEISGGSLDYLLATDGSGNLFWADPGNISTILGNVIDLGTPSLGNLVSNAVTMTANTTVTDGIAQLNFILGKLVPPSPPTFPGSQSLSISSLSTYRMANITQTNNSPNSYSVAAGATVTNVRRVSTYATNTISTVGPGDSGTLTLYRNNSSIASVTFNPNASPTGNGTYSSNLVITNNMDYNAANANIASGFWYVFSAAVSGSNAPAGWNDIVLVDSVAGTTNVPSWYYDNSSPSTPSFSSTTFTETANAFSYSSTIPHYTTATQYSIGTTVANVSGNMYPTSNALTSTTTAGGSFAAPVSVNYNASNVGSNILNAFQTVTFSTTSNITTGFGASSSGPSLAVNNSYSTGTLSLSPGVTVLRKTGNSTAVDEGNVVFTSAVGGSTTPSAFRIENPGAGNTPVYTANATTFNSQTSTLQTYDATVVGSGSQGVLKHDQTNYATGYLPVGPNLSSGRSGTQYFTFKFVRSTVSKFDITYQGNVAGMWVALPGSTIDSTSTANGWIDMSVSYAGAGIPGANTGAGGNGSNGCALGGVVPINVNQASSISRTATFGTVSSSSTATNEIYVRVALTSGQTVSALSLKAASN